MLQPQVSQGRPKWLDICGFSDFPRYVLIFLLKLLGRRQLKQLCRDAQRGDEAVQLYPFARRTQTYDLRYLSGQDGLPVVQRYIMIPRMSGSSCLGSGEEKQVQKQLLAEILRRHQDSPYAFQNGLQGHPGVPPHTLQQNGRGNGLLASGGGR